MFDETWDEQDEFDAITAEGYMAKEMGHAEVDRRIKKFEDSMKDKKFQILDQQGSDVLGGSVSGFNVYISSYGTLIAGKPPGELEVDETCTKRYALSGQKPTDYYIKRVE